MQLLCRTTRWKLRKQSSVLHHLDGSITMESGINLVEPVSQDANGIHSLLQSRPMAMDIHSISQPADYQRIRTELLQFFHKLLAEVLAVSCNLTCSHHADDMLTIQGRRASVIQQCRCIRAFTQAGRVGLVIVTDTLDMSCLCKGQFLLGSLQVCIHQGQRLQRLLVGMGDEFLQVLTLLEYLRKRAHRLQQHLAVYQIQTGNEGKRYGVKGLLLCHHFSR